MVAPAGEFDLIRAIRGRVQDRDHRLIKGIGDDCAVVPAPPGIEILSTTDTLLEDVHFTREWITPRQLGVRSIAINVSDIAAMGGVPRYALVSLGLTPADAEAFVDEYYRGVEEACADYGVSVIGGNLSSSPRGIMITVVLLGEAEEGRAIYRCGGKPGDTVCVTGTVGSAAAGVALLCGAGKPEVRNGPGEETAALLDRLVRPVARVREGRILARSGACTSMIDLSDGLASDLRRICEESRVGAEVVLASVPMDEAMVRVVERWGKRPTDYALYGGEDYELLFTLPKEREAELRRLWVEAEVGFTPIGRLVGEENGVTLLLPDGGRTAMPAGGHDHFKQRT